MPQNAEPLSLNAIGQIARVVHNLEAAVDFYRNALGMKVMFQAPGLAFFDCAGVRLMLTMPSPDFDQPNSVLYFRVDDLHAAHDALRARGVHIERGPHLVARLPDHELWMVFFRDNEDEMLALMSEVRV